MGPRAVASKPPTKRTWFKPGTTLPGEGAHNSSLFLLKVPALPAFLTARLPAVPDLCHHASEAQKQASCPQEMPPGPGEP